MTVGQIYTDSALEGADGELYVIGVVASDTWADEAAQVEYWKAADFAATEFVEFQIA